MLLPTSREQSKMDLHKGLMTHPHPLGNKLTLSIRPPNLESVDKVIIATHVIFNVISFPVIGPDYPMKA